MKRGRILAALVFAIMLTSCAENAFTREPDRLDFFALDTVISLTGCGDHSAEALREIQNDILKMENELSRTKQTSMVYRLNQSDGEKMKIPNQTHQLLEQAIELSKLTQGAFDITIAPAADLWGFTKDEIHVPEEQEIDAVKEKVGTEHIHLDEGVVWLDQGTEIDLGGIAKGQALEQALDVFTRYSLSGGIANLGGDILAYGTNNQNKPWKIAIQNPDYNNSKQGFLGTISMTDSYILTSGGYERYFEADNKKYQHIIDPDTCSPSESTLQSVTVIAPLDENNGVYADAIATALFVMDYENAVAYWKNSDFSFDMILADDLGHVYVTDGLRDCFTANRASGYDYIVLK